MISLELRILLAFLAAYFSAMFVIPKIASIARVIGLIDRPGYRKVHTVPRPLVGGIGIVIAATFSCLLFVPLEGFRGLFLGLAVLLFIGFLDDFRELGPRRKFLAQIGASVLMMYFGKAYLVTLGDLLGFGAINLPDIDVVIWLVTIFCVVGVINAVNLIDGLDGLAGGVSFVAFMTFALHACFAGESVLALINLAFAGAVLGFLRFNWQPSTVFMGDAGSLCLGFVLAYMAIVMTQGEGAVMSPVVPLLILAVPITDTITVMSKRLMRGKNPFKADQYHLHHIFMRYGMGRQVVVKVILGICMALSGVTLLMSFYDIPEYVLFGIYLFYLSGYILASFFIVYTMRFSLKYKKRRENEGSRDRTAVIVRSLLNGIDLLKIFRKDTRYQVKLGMTCRVKESGETFPGKIVNISNRGCMASIPGLEVLRDKVVVEIYFPIDNDVNTIPLPAEHLWVSETENGCHHGFRFQEFVGDEQTIFLQFMVKFNKRTKRHEF